MEIRIKNRYLLSIYEESFLKVFKHFKPLRVCNCGAGLWYLKVLIKIFKFSLKSI